MGSIEEKIIEFVRSNPVLYDKRNPRFKNKLLKERKWRRFAKELGISTRIVKNRWKTLRDRFHRIHKCDNMEAPIGSRRPLKFFNQLFFLVKNDDAIDSYNENVSDENMTSEEHCTSDVEDELDPLEKVTSKEVIDLVKTVKSSVMEQTPVKIFFDSFAMEIENSKMSSLRFTSLQIKLLKALQEEIEMN